MSILNALRRLESGYRQGTSVELAKLRLDEQARQFDERMELEREKFEVTEDLQELNRELKEQQLDAFKLDRFIKATNIMQSNLQEDLVQRTNDLFTTIASFQPVEDYLDDTTKDGAGPTMVEKLVKDFSFSREDALDALDLVNNRLLVQKEPSMIGNYTKSGLRLSAKIQNQLTGASPSNKGIAKAFEDAKILTKENANAVFNKYKDYNRIKESLNSLSQERKDAYLNKDYELPATEDDIDTIARQLIGE